MFDLKHMISMNIFNNTARKKNNLANSPATATTGQVNRSLALGSNDYPSHNHSLKVTTILTSVGSHPYTSLVIVMSYTYQDKYNVSNNHTLVVSAITKQYLIGHFVLLSK